jgi:predicted dehydrogenase
MYRVGIVGAGFGARAHLPAFSAHPDFEVAGIASPHNAQRIAKERGIPHAFESCEELLRGCDVDVVSIAAPPFTHHADVLGALDAGKHVICEKPFAVSVEQAEEMLAAAQRARTACAVMHEFRWVPQRLAVKELIENGHLSPLREIEITQLSNRLRADVERARSWWFERERGGGMAGALLSHLVDSATWLAGRPPVRSTGFLRTANRERHDAQGIFTSTVDDGCWALIDYGDGLVARVSVDATTPVESFTLAAHAENRTAVASGTDFDDMRLFSVDEDETSELDVKPSPYARFSSVDRHVPFIMEFLDEFVKQIREGKSAVPTFEDAVHTQRVLASIGYGMK